MSCPFPSSASPSHLPVRVLACSVCFCVFKLSRPNQNQQGSESVPLKTPEPSLTMGDLTQTEAAAASLGVHPDALKPIAFLNQAHYETLSKSNAISGDLAQKIAAFQTVAGGE